MSKNYDLDLDSAAAIAFMIGVAGMKEKPKVYLDWKDSENIKGVSTFDSWTAIIAENLEGYQQIMLYRFDMGKNVNVFHGNYFGWQQVNKYIKKEMRK
jgi:hypothetical protein